MRHNLIALNRKAMSQMLVVNDIHGSRVMREAILDDMNRLNRELNRVIDLWLTNDSAPGS